MHNGCLLLVFMVLRWAVFSSTLLATIGVISFFMFFGRLILRFSFGSLCLAIRTSLSSLVGLMCSFHSCIIDYDIDFCLLSSFISVIATKKLSRLGSQITEVTLLCYLCLGSIFQQLVISISSYLNLI